jgi:hypothetical protein
MLNLGSASRDRLFYDKYEYGICVTLEEAGCLRAKSSQELTSIINYRNNSRSQWGGSYRHSIEGSTLEHLLAAWEEIDRCREHIKMVISYNVMYIYSNDLGLLERLADLPYLELQSAVQAKLDRPRDVVLKTDPKFRLRSYFRDKLLDKTQCERLLSFVESRKDIFGTTTGFKSSLNRFSVHYLQRHQFIEHNDMKDITMLSLVIPGLIRKTVSVQAK